MTYETLKDARSVPFRVYYTLQSEEHKHNNTTQLPARASTAANVNI